MKYNRKTHGGILPERTLTQPVSDKPYIPTWQPLRPGADDALSIPSRTGNVLRYRDGRKVVLS